MTPEEILNYQPAGDLLKDRVILVTGASDGIGRAVSRAYARHGATIILLSKTIKKLEEVYDEIEADGGPKPAIYPLNMQGATPKDYKEMAENIEKEFGRLDGLLNNAAWLGAYTPFVHYEPELWTQVITVNLQAPYMITHACLPLLEKASDPAIVFSSHESMKAYNGAFGVAKAGQHAMMKILADEYSDTDITIRVNSVDTGPARTMMRRMHYPGENPMSVPDPADLVAPYLYFMGPECTETGTDFSIPRARGE
ncbi:MAG: YciK family oxidoreductase [Gammaproteobacteria bacterium]